jgi:hypothetical protein
MTDHTLKDFIRRVEQENKHRQFLLLDGQPIQTISIKEYKPQNDEKNALVKALEDELSFVSLINEMREVLEKSDNPRNKELENYVRNLRMIFSTYATEGHYAGRYFTRILSMLEGFISFIRLSNQRDEELLSYLQSLSSGQSDRDAQLHFMSKNLSFYRNYKARYLKELEEYEHVFHDFLKSETEKSKGLKVITRTEQCLLTLTDKLQHSLDQSHSILNLLSQYDILLRLVENQTRNN